MDQTRGRFSYHRIEIEAQQFIPLFNARRVIALRGRTTLTETGDRQQVPFYLQPVTGGSETLRGYRPFRFDGNQALVMTAEYRYEIFSGLDMALFADAGKVASRRQDLDFYNLESSVGFGFRFNVRNSVFLRIDTAFSHEGFQVWFKFNNVFAWGPVKTSSGHDAAVPGGRQFSGRTDRCRCIPGGFRYPGPFGVVMVAMLLLSVCAVFPVVVNRYRCAAPGYLRSDTFSGERAMWLRLPLFWSAHNSLSAFVNTPRLTSPSLSGS